MTSFLTVIEIVAIEMAGYALVMACIDGNTDIVSDLLQNGVFPDLSNSLGLSGLIAASTSGHTKIVEFNTVKPWSSSRSKNTWRNDGSNDGSG